MNVKELKDKLEELIEYGYGDYPVFVDISSEDEIIHEITYGHYINCVVVLETTN